MRLFLAITLPDGLKAEIARAVAPAREGTPGVRWVRTELLHLTVKFVGERLDGEEQLIMETARSALRSAEPVMATIGGAGAFPNFRKARVVWIGMHPVAPLADIARRVDTALSSVGIAAERRPFQAHITLGRIAAPLVPEAARSLERALHAVRDEWVMPVREVALMQSTLGREGPAYRVLKKIPLGEQGVS